VPLRDDAASELAAAFEELHAPGPFLALSNGDAESNNCLVYESGSVDARLIDFEAASYGHALLDAVCLPRSRASVAVGRRSGRERARLIVIGGRWLRACRKRRTTGSMGSGLAAACASWALLRLQRWALLDERAPGDHSRLQLVETVESAARAAAAHDAVPALAGWFRRVGETLRGRWPDTDVDLGRDLDLDRDRHLDVVRDLGFADPVRLPPYSPRL
jgi:hypothetical protein